MKIAILGSGSIGLYYGAKLASAGEDVHFLLRSGLDEARKDGIRIHEEHGEDLHLHPVNAHATTGTIGPCDLAIVSMKTTQNRALSDLVPPLLAESTMILTLQNGLGSDEDLAEQFGPGRVLGGLCFVCLTRRSPAQVDHMGRGALSIGEFGRPVQPRTREVAEAFSRAGIRTGVVDDLAAERWRKLVWNIPFNGLSVAEGDLTVDRLLADPRIIEEIRALMKEVIATARALGHDLADSLVDFNIGRTLKMGPYKPSTMVDHLAGLEIEIDSIWGEPLRRARRAHLSTPHLAALHERLKACAPTPYEMS